MKGIARRLRTLIVVSLLPVAAARSGAPASPDTAPGNGVQLSRHRAGEVYSTPGGRQVDPAGLGFWLFTRSKRVWFRVDDVPYGQPFPHGFSYAGRPILHVSDLASWRAQPRPESRPIVWGDHVGGGWGRGPGGTNYYLSIWTRWSLQHPAFAHPERFELHYQPSMEKVSAQGAS